MTTDNDVAGPVTAAPTSAARVCDDVIEWYARYAIRARTRYRLLEMALLVVGASISVAALAWPGNGVPAAMLGGVVVVLTGLRQVFHWQENYVRFTSACLTLRHERRRYDVGEPPYHDVALRDRRLMEVVNSVEAKETHGWAELVENRRRPHAGGAGS